jgi:hypothetical protein
MKILFTPCDKRSFTIIRINFGFLYFVPFTKCFFKQLALVIFGITTIYISDWLYAFFSWGNPNGRQPTLWGGGVSDSYQLKPHGGLYDACQECLGSFL